MFNFEIDGDKLRIRPMDTFGNGSNCVIYLEKFDGSKWNSLAYPDFYIGDTSEKIYQSIEAALVEINETLESLYGKGVPAPESGFELVQWIIDNKLSLSEDNKLSIKQ